MKITIEATPNEVKDLLQAVGSSLEQITNDLTDVPKKFNQLSERLEELIEKNISFIGNKRPATLQDAQALHELIRSYIVARS